MKGTASCSPLDLQDVLFPDRFINLQVLWKSFVLWAAGHP